MARCFGQFLALVVLMASVVNAQCLAACSSQVSNASAAQKVSRADHTCCRHHHLPQKNSQQTSCTHAAASLETAPVPNSDHAKAHWVAEFVPAAFSPVPMRSALAVSLFGPGDHLPFGPTIRILKL